MFGLKRTPLFIWTEIRWSLQVKCPLHFAHFHTTQNGHNLFFFRENCLLRILLHSGEKCIKLGNKWLCPWMKYCIQYTDSQRTHECGRDLSVDLPQHYLRELTSAEENYLKISHSIISGSSQVLKRIIWRSPTALSQGAHKCWRE